MKKGCRIRSKPNGPSSMHPTISLPGDSLALRRMLPFVAMPVVLEEWPMWEITLFVSSGDARINVKARGHHTGTRASPD